MTPDDMNEDELYSMDELEKDLDGGRGARRLPWFAAGLVLGIAGALLVPRFAGPYLPSGFGGAREILSGPVLDVREDAGRLLLTIETEAGALIASFSERVAEIGMLISAGDTVTIAVSDYDPFVENPDFEGVRKARPAGPAAAGMGADADTSGVGREETGADADTSGVGRDRPGGSTEEPLPGDSSASGQR